MRYIQRTHHVSVAWLHELGAAKEIQLGYEDTNHMCADVFTKAFTNVVSWAHAYASFQIISLATPYDFGSIS